MSVNIERRPRTRGRGNPHNNAFFVKRRLSVESDVNHLTQETQKVLRGCTLTECGGQFYLYFLPEKENELKACLKQNFHHSDSNWEVIPETITKQGERVEMTIMPLPDDIGMGIKRIVSSRGGRVAGFKYINVDGKQEIILSAILFDTLQGAVMREGQSPA